MLHADLVQDETFYGCNGYSILIDGLVHSKRQNCRTTSRDSGYNTCAGGLDRNVEVGVDADELFPSLRVHVTHSAQSVVEDDGFVALWPVETVES